MFPLTGALFGQPLEINALTWLSDTRFVTLSGHMLRIWDIQVISWDYAGKQLFEFDLTVLHMQNRIPGIALNADRSRIITAYSNGNLSAFYAPLGFLRQQLGLSMDCDPYLKLIEMNCIYVNLALNLHRQIKPGPSSPFLMMNRCWPVCG